MTVLNKTQIQTVVCLLCATFLAVFNQTLLTPALPTIMKDMQVTVTTAQWLTSGYSLVEAIVIPLAAYLMGRFSTRELYIGGLSLFALGSAIAACAPSFAFILLGRVFQAICTGALLPMSTSLILLTFPKNKRGSAMGLVGLIIGFAPALGPCVSGLLVDSVGWRILFAMIAVLAVIVAIIGAVLLKNYEGFPRTSFDLLSVVLSSLGMVYTLYGLSTISSVESIVLPVVLIICGVILLGIFVKRQLALDEPMLKVGILKSSRYRSAVIVVAVIQASFLGLQTIFPLYIQDVCGYSATMSGLALLPGSLGGAVAGMVAGMLFDRFGVRRVAIPAAFVVVLGGIGLALYQVDTTFAFITLVYFILSLGLQMVTAPLNTWGINSLDNSVVQHAQSLSNTLNQVAGSLGTAILVSCAAFGSSLSGAAPGSAQVLFDGYRVSFCVGTALFVLTFILVCAFTRHDKEKSRS